MNSLTAEAATTGRICTRYYTIQSSYNAKNELKFSLSAEVGQEFDMGRLLYFWIQRIIK